MYCIVYICNIGKPHRWAQYEEELAACFHRLEEAFLQVHHRRSCTNPSCSLHPAISTSTSAEATDTNGTTAAGTDAVPSASPAGTEGHSEDEDQLILRPALEMFYLWATFAPLSRGTAACGYASLCAVLLSFGRQVAGAALLPRGKQLDWEAILAVDFEAFWTKVRGWFKLVPASPALMVAVNHPWRVPAGGAGDSADVEVVSDAPSDAPISSGSSSCSSSSGGGEEEGMFECVRTLRDMLDVMNLPYGN